MCFSLSCLFAFVLAFASVDLCLSQGESTGVGV